MTMRPLRDPPQPVEVRLCPICEGCKVIDKRDLDVIMKLITSDDFSNQTSILQDQEQLLHRVKDRERSEARNRRSHSPPHRSALPGSSGLRLGGASVSVPAKSPVPGEPPRDIREQPPAKATSEAPKASIVFQLR